MTEGQWIGAALGVTALAVSLLAVAGVYLGSVLARVADALEALRPPAAKPRVGAQPVPTYPEPWRWHAR